MYVPHHFKEEDQSQLLQYIREYSFGTLIISDGEGLEANHIPFYLSSSSDDTQAQLQCHLARSNPTWQRIQSGAHILVVFQGPNAYVSPSWYVTKAESGRVVPTWNYLAVHVQGTARVIQDSAWLRQHLGQLTERHESNLPDPWSVDDAPTEFIDRLEKAIVGIEISIDVMTGKLKASQNQPESNRQGVRSALIAKSDSTSQAMAELMK